LKFSDLRKKNSEKEFERILNEPLSFEANREKVLPFLAFLTPFDGNLQF